MSFWSFAASAWRDSRGSSVMASAKAVGLMGWLSADILGGGMRLVVFEVELVLKRCEEVGGKRLG